MNTSNLKDKLTDWLAVIMIIGGAINAYLQANSGAINWYQLGMAVVIAVLAYFTGKKPDGKTKTPTEVAVINAK